MLALRQPENTLSHTLWLTVCSQGPVWSFSPLKGFAFVDIEVLMKIGAASSRLHFCLISGRSLSLKVSFVGYSARLVWLGSVVER